MTIYMDEIFIVNLLMDALMLWAAGKLMQRPVSLLRLIVSAGVGAFYGVIIFLPSCIWLANGAAKAICALLMAWIAFGWVNWRTYIKAVIYMYLVSFTLGGSTVALMYFCGQYIVQTWSGIALMEVEFSLFRLVVGAAMILVLVHILHKTFQKKLEQALQIIPVTVQLRDKFVSLRLLVDSGNCLTDPIGGMPVVVVQIDYVRRLFSNDELQKMELTAIDAVMQLSDLSERIRLLPFQTVGYRGLMLGVRVDEMRIDVPQPQAKTISKTDVVMALSPQQFAADGSYHGIISPLLLV